jgi:hypothetical protein
MHGKHSRMMFIPLYRNTVCYYGIDSRKCAIGIEINLDASNIKKIKGLKWPVVKKRQCMFDEISACQLCSWEVTPH